MMNKKSNYTPEQLQGGFINLKLNTMATLKEIREDHKNNKAEWDELLNAGTNAKIEKCTIKDKFGKGKDGFDYIKMSIMWHAGQW